MEHSKSQKYCNIFVALLAVCNVALIATIWLKPAQPLHDMRLPGRHINFNKRLQLTDDQREKFVELSDLNQKKIDSLKKEATQARAAFFAGMKTEQVNLPLQDSLGTVVANYHKAIELQTFTHFNRLRGMLTANQKTVFDSIIIDVLRQLPEQPRMHRDGHRPPPPGMGDGPDGPPPMGPPEGE
jgi:Spy/CpxP family protein refolding chaperone